MTSATWHAGSDCKPHFSALVEGSSASIWYFLCGPDFLIQFPSRTTTDYLDLMAALSSALHEFGPLFETDDIKLGFQATKMSPINFLANSFHPRSLTKHMEVFDITRPRISTHC